MNKIFHLNAAKMGALGSVFVLLLAFVAMPASAAPECYPGYPCFKIVPVNPTCEYPKFSVKVKYLNFEDHGSQKLYLEDWSGEVIETLDQTRLKMGEKVIFKDSRAFAEGESRDYAVSILDKFGIEPLEYLSDITMPDCN